MKKRAGPAFRRQSKPLKACTECKDGVVTGLFHDLPCNHCHGSGLVDKETGQGLAVEDLVIQLGMRWRAERDRNARLRNQLAGRKQGPANDDRGYGPMGKRYHGD